MTWTEPENEYEALIYVVDRLARRFPTVDESVINGLVVDELEQLGFASIRTYVPMLVERNVLRHLRELTAQRHLLAS